MQIRLANTSDAAGVQMIYAPIVRDTAISFETEIPSVTEMSRRIASTLVDYPWFVAVDDAGVVAGYVYAGRYAERAAYRWSVVSTVYIRADQRGRGLAKQLYAALLNALRAQGICQVYAGITQPNAGSVALHESLGFTRVGTFGNAGYKLEAWHDVGYWQLNLQLPNTPTEPRAFST